MREYNRLLILEAHFTTRRTTRKKDSNDDWKLKTRQLWGRLSVLGYCRNTVVQYGGLRGEDPLPM